MHSLFDLGRVGGSAGGMENRRVREKCDGAIRTGAEGVRLGRRCGQAWRLTEQECVCSGCL